MKLVVGLGNPGTKYENTRHNVGYRVIDELARRWAFERSRRRFNGHVGDGWISEQRVLLLKPTTFMNLSGRSVREALTFHKLGPADLLVVTDDMALPVGRVRCRQKGSAGGHNGLANIIQELGDNAFCRLRIGIGQVDGSRMVGHVLGPFNRDEGLVVEQTIVSAADAVECWLTDGAETVMNRFNRVADE